MAKNKNKKHLWKLAGAGLGAIAIVFATVLANIAPADNLKMASTQVTAPPTVGYWSIDSEMHGGDCTDMGGIWDGIANVCTLPSGMTYNLPLELHTAGVDCNGSTFDLTSGDVIAHAAIYSRPSMLTNEKGPTVKNCNINIFGGMIGISVNENGKSFQQGTDVQNNTVTGGWTGAYFDLTDGTYIQNNNFNSDNTGLYISPYSTRTVFQFNDLCTTDGPSLATDPNASHKTFNVFDPSSDHNKGDYTNPLVFADAPTELIYQDASAAYSDNFEFGCTAPPPTQDYHVRQDNIPFVANEPGNYFVDEDVIFSDSNPIPIIVFMPSAAGSTLDVQNHIVAAWNGTGIEVNASDVRIKNGFIVDNQTAIQLNESADNVTIEANILSGNDKYLAIEGTIDNLTFIRNVIPENGPSADLSNGTLNNPTFAYGLEIGNYFASDAMAKELEGTLPLVEDFNQDGFYDADPSANPSNIYFTDQFLDFGGYAATVNSMVRLGLFKNLNYNALKLSIEKNTNMYSALLNQTVDADQMFLSIGDKIGEFDKSKLTYDSPILIAASSDARGHVWAEDVAPDTSALGQKLHLLIAPFADGMMVGAVSTDTEAGNGALAKDNLENFFTTTFTMPEGNNAVWCDGVMVDASATDCATLSFGKIDDAMNTTYSYHIEAGKGAQAHLKEKAVDDVKVDTASDYTLTDASLEGPTNFAITDPELIAYDDVLDVNFGKEAKMNVEVDGSGVTVTVLADELPTNDDAELGGKPAKLALGMSIYPHSDGYSVGSLTHATTVVSDVGLNFIPTAQSDIEASRLPAISKNFDNVNFIALSRSLHNRVREAVEILGTPVYQSKPGAVYGATGIAAVGGDLTVNNCNFDTYNDSVAIPQYAKDAVAADMTLHGDKLSLAVGYANSTNDEYYVKVANNTIKNAKAGIAVANARTDVWDNDITLTTKAAWEDWSDMAADYMYSDKVQSDLPTATGDVSRTDGQNPFAVHPQGVGIAISAGGDQDYFAANGTDSVYDAYGNIIKTDIEALVLDKGHAVTALRNKVTTESGIGLAIGGEVGKAQSLCLMDSFDPAVDEACAADSDVAIVVDDLTVEPTGNIPEDSANEAYTRLDLVADGADVCMASVYSGLEEQNIVPELSPKTIKSIEGKDVEVYDVPTVYISDVNCVKSGAVVAGGSAGQYLRRITNTDAQYDAFAFGISGQNSVKRALSEAVIDNLGVNFAGFISLKDSSATGEGQMHYTISDNQIADSNGQNGIVSSKGFDNAVAIALDNHSLAQNSYYFIDNSTLDEVSVDVSGLETVNGTVDNVQYIYTNNVVDNNGAMSMVEYVNDENYYAQAVNAAEMNTNPQEGDYVSYFAKVKRAGQLTHEAADSGVTVYAMDYSCTQSYQGWDIAGMIAGCTISSSDSPESVDDKWAYYNLEVPTGSVVMQAVKDTENLDSWGDPIYAKSEVNYLDPINSDLSMVDLQALVLTQAKMKGAAHKGSQLWVFEPIEVLWESETAIYPFVFESDSDWTVDVCLSVPEGYMIVEPEECVQTFIANETKTINFVVQEVGTINTDSETDMTLVNPEGKKTKVKTKIQNRLGKKFIEEFLDKNADALAAAGYYLDEKGRIKKLK